MHLDHGFGSVLPILRCFFLLSFTTIFSFFISHPVAGYLYITSQDGGLTGTHHYRSTRTPTHHSIQRAASAACQWVESFRNELACFRVKRGDPGAHLSLGSPGLFFLSAQGESLARVPHLYYYISTWPTIGQSCVRTQGIETPALLRFNVGS